MCGIAGFSCTGEFEERLKVALPILASHMARRGSHSWGFTNGVDIVKELGDIQNNLAYSEQGHKTTLIHTRHATTGARTKENSHPFKIGKILGVHNGIIYSHKEIAKKYGYEYQVDSEVLFHQLNAGRDLSELAGYGAIVFFEDGVIHLGAFQGGSLILVKATWGWLWASTAEAVNAAFRMSGLNDTAQFQVKLKEGVLYQLRGERIVKDKRKLSIGKSTWSANDRAATSGISAGTSGYWDDYMKDKKTSYVNKDTGWDPAKRQLWYHKTGTWIDRPKDDDPMHPAYISGEGMAMWDVSEKRYVVKPIVLEVKALPIPTEATTTFKSSLSDEPTSDYDDVIEQEDNDDPDDYCNECGTVLMPSDEFIVVNHATLCKICFTDLADDIEGDDKPGIEYDFAPYTIAEVEDTLGMVSRCDDCRMWAPEDSLLYVEASENFVVCSECYHRNYSTSPNAGMDNIEQRPSLMLV